MNGINIAGPLVGRMLVQAGATVTAITPPDGPLWRHEIHNVLSRGKTVVPINLKTAEGRRRAIEMMADADVRLNGPTPTRVA